MSDNNSDYNKPFTNLFKLLPEPYQSKTSETVFHNLFNRFLTKTETEQVAGYIGKGNFDTALQRRQIREFNVHRQAEQLQPILYNKVGSVEWMASWMDLLNEADRLGIDRERLPQWLNIQQFNWVPPIDIDKLINYRDYYWYDPENPTSSPQYITIRSRCQRAKSFVNFTQNLVDQYGQTISVVDVGTIDQTAPTFDIKSIDHTTQTVVVDGDATDTIGNHDYFIIEGTTDNNGVHRVDSTPTYSIQNHETTLTVQSGSFTSSETAIGQVRARLFDKLLVDGDYTQLLESGFVFLFADSSNAEINDTFVQVVDSTFNTTTGRTAVQIDVTFTDDAIGGGVISLQEKLNSAIADRDCLCSGTIGWDIFQWDDNPDDPLWNNHHDSLISQITNNGPPTTPGMDGQLWYDQIADQLYQYNADQPTVGWKVLWNNFSKLLEDTAGQAFWDFVPGCGVSSQIPAADQWIDQNQWLHKRDVASFTIAKQAQIPILEYDWDLELNEWTYVEYQWKYRSENSDTFATTSVKPSVVELTPLRLWELDASGSNDVVILDERYGDLTNWFTPGTFFMGVNKTDIIEVVDSRFTGPGPEQPMRTEIEVVQDIGSSDLTPGDLNNVQASPSPLRPYRTSQDDPWSGYNTHWLLDTTTNPVATVHQPQNPLLAIDPQQVPVEDVSINAELKHSDYAQQFTVLSLNPTNTYELLAPTFDIIDVQFPGASGEFVVQGDREQYFPEGSYVIVEQSTNNDGTYLISGPASYNNGTNRTTIPIVNGQNLDPVSDGAIRALEQGTTRRLRHRALLGHDDIRVYINDIRQYGNYDELEDVIVNVSNITEVTPATSPRSFEITVDADVSTAVTAGDVVRYEQDTNIIGASYIVDSVSTNTITVQESDFADLSNAGGNGALFNLTSPITDVDGGISYVRGIQFLPQVNVERFDTILIEVGPAAATDFGYAVASVRTIENNQTFNAQGPVTTSLINYNKVEQVKTQNNQYPLFDIYHVDGTPANVANQIFGYQTDPEEDVNALIGQRIVVEPELNDYEYEQLLLTDDGRMLAYRDYSNHDNQYWYNPQQQIVFAWTGLAWSEKTRMGNRYTTIAVQKNQPERPFDQQLWFNTVTEQLNIYDIGTGTWSDVNKPLTITNDDPTLQTIWRKGLNNETYQPVKIDWNMRTEQQYNDQRDAFVAERVTELQLDKPSLTNSQAHTQAIQDWLDKQKKGAQELSPTGQFVGDWEIPGPLYYNHMHENRRNVSQRELLTHFTTIIENQPKVPGFDGRGSDMFRLIATEDVNYGLGGRIKEYNHSFDTFLSSLFVNNITPVTLIEFAQQQYEKQLNNTQELFRQQSIDLLTTTTTTALQDLGSFVAEQVISQHEQNDASARIYGDTSAFTDVPGGQDTGVRNWIATLPHFDIVRKQQPIRLTDTKRGIDQIIHHDGHRAGYVVEPAVVESIIQSVLQTNDPRASNPDTFGRQSTSLPPNTGSEFSANFNTTISGREGTYWYTNGTLYRLEVVAAGTTEPSSTLQDGSLWFDTTFGSEVLRIKQTDSLTNVVDWVPVSGVVVGDGRLHNGTDPNDLTTATISAWQQIDIAQLLLDTILEIEQRLFTNVTDPNELVYDIDQLQQQYPQLFDQLLQERFLAHVSEQQIQQPFANDQFALADPFTWNYRYSTIGQGYNILDVDSDANFFVVEGNRVAAFDPCTANNACPSQISFYVKNSGTNDGSWSTLISTNMTVTAVYDSGTDTTSIYVDGDVSPVSQGIIYNGLLPSSSNTGAESGGDWRDLYNDFYNTPYPHLEPWRLQGYHDKPDWWDQEYLNDDVDKWGDRRWKYSHGFDVVNVDQTNDTFAITGDFREVLLGGHSFQIDQSVAIHDGTWVVAELGDVTNVVTGTVGNASIQVSGDVTNVLSANDQFAVVDSSQQLTALLTVSSIAFTGPNTTIQVAEAIDSSSGFDAVSGSVYDPSTNRLTIHIDTSASSPPFNNDITSNDVSGRIPISYGMWETIRVGEVPPGRVYPNGVVSVTGNPSMDDTLHGLTVPNIPTYNYFSVNIDNQFVSSDGGTTKFFPDDILPPFWNFSTYFGTAAPAAFDRTIRSLFFQFSTEISNPSAEYTFGDAGPEEWLWKTSSQYLYDRLIVAFRIDPVRVLSSTFGIDFTYIGGLNINSDTDRVFAHNRTNFHGEVVNEQPYQINGLNQWYVNYNRARGVDASYGDFRTLWTGWTAPLMYQFSSFLDTQSLLVDHRDVCISEFDHMVTAKRSPGVEDYWIHSFNVSAIDIPPPVARHNNQSDWRFELRTPSSVGQTVQYYDVQNYQFFVDVSTNICTLYTYPVQDADPINDTFTINGNQTQALAVGNQFDVVNSTGNDGTYTVASSAYNVVSDITVVQVQSSVPDTTNDGLIKADYRQLPWLTGDSVVFSSDETLPLPLEGDNINGVNLYYIIRVDDHSFRVARTHADAIAGTEINLTTTGRRNSYVGQINSTFTALDGQQTDALWKHYVVDKTNVLQVTPPVQVQGIQSMINLIEGYQQYAEDQGWRFNEDHSLLDPVHQGRFVSWQLEIERFIDFIHGLRRIRSNVPEQYQATVDQGTNVWTFTENSSSQLITGDTVNVFVSNNVYPTPLTRGARYYMIRDSLDQFRLAATKGDAQSGTEIDITSTAGVGTIHVAPANVTTISNSTFEINPFRQGIWFAPERGIVSNTATGPTEDFRNTQLLFDQYSRPFDPEDIVVFREDQLTSINVPEDIDNDVELTRVFENPHNYIHLGGAHIFIDTHEHVLRFNNYTTDGQLLYDPFVGLNVTKFELQYQRQPQFTQRPNVGGHFLLTDNNQGADLFQNFEANVEGIRHMYDTYTVSENSLLTQRARDALGFENDSLDYFNDINLNDKSKFIFWRGMIQQKGSVNAINAFINSRRFIDAEVDEFWAFKLAQFGSAFEKEYIPFKLTVADARTNQLRLSFASEGDLCLPGFASNNFDGSDCGFAYPNSGTPILPGGDNQYQTVQLDQEQRWFEQPDQFRKLSDNGQTLYFTTTVNDKFEIDTDGQPTPLEAGDNWIENISGTLYALKRFDGTQTTEHGRWDTSTSTPLLRHNFASDGLDITLSWRQDGHVVTRNVPSTFDVVSTTPTGSGNGQITVDGDQTLWLAQGDVVQITSTTAEGRYTITSSPSLVGGDTVLVVDYIVGSGSGGITSNVSGTAILTFGDDVRELTIDSYLPLTGSLTVFQDGQKLVQGDDFTEALQGNALASTTLLFDSDIKGTTISIVYGTSTLLEEVHYEHLNSNIVRLLFNDLVDPQVRNLTLWGIVVDEQSQNPARIIDKNSDVVISPVQIWDPARGHHYANAIHIVDLINQQDPAVYTNTPNVNEPDSGAWNQNEVGTTWLDTSNLGYKPYYDTAIYDDVTIRTKRWGDLADWADLTIYTWVESDVPPDQWDAQAAQEEIDSSIPQRERKSGRVSPTLFEKDMSGDWVPAQSKVDVFDVAIEGTGVGSNTYQFTLSNIPVVTATVDSVDAGSNEIVLDTNFERQLDQGMQFVVDQSGTDVTYTVDSVSFEGTTSTVTVQTTPTASAGQGVTFIERTNLYINNVLRQQDAVLVPVGGTDVQITSLQLQDRVRLEQPLPTDQEQIDAQVQAGTLLQQVEHTTRTRIDQFGAEQTLYYFWVANKLTRGDRIMSPNSAEQSLVMIPQPFMFTQGLQDAATVIVDSIPQQLPTRYTRVIVRGLKGLIDDDERYVLRFTRNYTLRDNLDAGDTALQLKNLHNEWELVRQQQQFNIPRRLWDQITEAIVGYELNDSTNRVPSLDRELYDQQYGTDTQFGLGQGQAFCDGQLALNAILADLRNDQNDFSPIDINVFFQNNNFDTDQGIIDAMNRIYNTFAFNHVNRMFFSILHNAALPVKAKYPGIIKTSMLSLHGIRPFQQTGAFDD